MWKQKKSVSMTMKTATCAIRPHQRGEFASFNRASRKNISPAPEGASVKNAVRGISDCWRKNTSSLEAVELANLLRALRKVAGHLGDNVGRIDYTGMSMVCDHGILIEPDTVMGQYPVPAEKVDFLVGLVVHEALHRREWTDHVWKLLEPAMDAMTPRAKVIFQKFVNTGERIYTDLRSDQSVFGLYTRIARGKAIDLEEKRFSKAGPCVDRLLTTWWRCAFGSGKAAAKEYDALLMAFSKITEELKTMAHRPGGVIRCCEERAGLYRDTWKKIESSIISWKVIDKHLQWFSYSKNCANREKQTKDRSTDKNKTPTQILLQKIETRLSADAVDITPLIRSVAGFDNETVAPMSRWDFQTASRPVVDRKMIGRLRSVFAHYADRNTLMSRGLESGHIDRRRLHRAWVDGRCFKAVDRIPSPDWSVGLLVDASGSMRGNKWQMVENTIATIHKALSGDHNRLNAWAYFEVSGICMISRLIDKNRLFSVPPAGQTASGQAIIAAAGMMPGNAKRRLLIHITDGESNFGCDVSYGLEFCRERNIQLITLGCGYKDRPAMEAQYGRSIQFIDYFEQLPRAMEMLFKWAFVYGNEKTRLNC
jgi:hypothetical protein